MPVATVIFLIRQRNFLIHPAFRCRFSLSPCLNPRLSLECHRLNPLRYIFPIPTFPLCLWYRQQPRQRPFSTYWQHAADWILHYRLLFVFFSFIVSSSLNFSNHSPDNLSCLRLMRSQSDASYFFQLSETLLIKVLYSSMYASFVSGAHDTIAIAINKKIKNLFHNNMVLLFM